MMPLHDSIVTDSSLQGADRIRHWISTRLTSAGVDPENVSRMMLAAAEIATNISRHAYRGDPGGTIAARLDVRPDLVRLCLAHRGEPFDRTACPQPDLKELHEGGYGIYLVEALMDQVLYEQDRPDGHRVVLIRHLEQPSGSARRYNAGHEPEP